MFFYGEAAVQDRYDNWLACCKYYSTMITICLQLPLYWRIPRFKNKDSPKPLSHAQSLTEILNLQFKILLTLTIAAILQKGNFLKQHLSPHKCPLFLKQQVFP